MLPRFPCRSDKRPACAHWPQAASPDTVIPAGMLTAVPTGAASGLAVLDIDRGGLDWLAEHRDRLPLTREHGTRSGGRHFWFRDREGLRNSAGVIAPGVDVRGEGGYVIDWSREGFAVEHADVLAEWPEWLFDAAMQGKRAAPFLTLPDGHLLSKVALPPPSTLLQEEALFGRFKQTVPRFSFEDTIGWSASNRAFTRVSNAQPGSRNHTLNGEAYALGRIVARGWLAGGNAVFVLGRGAETCGYLRDHGEGETVAAIRHGLLDGMGRPYPDVSPRAVKR